MIEVEITGNGKFAGKRSNISGYAVDEESTPLDPGDSTGGVGTFEIVVTEDSAPDGTILLLNDGITITDSAAGITSGYVDSISVNGAAATVSGSGELSLFVGTGYIPPFSGTLKAAVENIANRAGVTSPIVVDTAIQSVQVRHGGGYLDYWLLLRDLCTATGVAEIAYVSNKIVVREPRQNEARIDRVSDLSWGVSNVELAQNVEVKYWNYNPLTSQMVFPYGGWAMDTYTVGPIGASETQTFNIPVNVALTSITQPTAQDFVSRDYSGPDSVYAVAGNDGLPIPAAQWRAQGGRLRVSIGQDRRSIDVSVTGASEVRYAPYQIAVASGPSDYYSALRIMGSGYGFREELITVPTGAPASKTSQEVGITIDNPWIDTYEDAMDVALRAAGRFAAPMQTVDITASVINSSTGSYEFPTFADFAAQYPTETFAQFDAAWPTETFADFDEYQWELVENRFVNQVFGNAGGARIRYRDAYYRIRSATTSENGIVNASAERDTIFSDFNAQYSGVTFANWDSIWSGRKFEDYAVIPLATS